MACKPHIASRGETFSRANVSRIRKRLGINQDNSFARNARLKFERLVA